MGILDRGETSAPPLGADYEHREEYHPPVWYRRGEEANPFLRASKVSSSKGKGHKMGKKETKVVDVKPGDAGPSGDSFLVLSAVRMGRGAGRDIAAATGLSIQKVGALLSRLSHAKAITRDGNGRWVDLTAPVTKVAKPAHGAPREDAVLWREILESLGENGLGDAELVGLFGQRALNLPLALRCMLDAGVVRKDGDIWVPSSAQSAASANSKRVPKPRRTPEVADRMTGVVRAEQSQISEQTARNTAADFSRIMENSRRLNGILGETLLLIQEIHALNQDLADEWYQLQRCRPVLEKAS
jgi:hypothetical protein